MEVFWGYQAIFEALAGGALIAVLLIYPVLRIRGGSITTQNYAGREIPVVGGILIILSLLVGYALVNVYRHLLDPPTHSPMPRVYLQYATGPLLAAVGFFSLGLIDDLAGYGATKGFRGHARALARGELTTGGVKAIGGGLLALIVASVMGSSSAAALLLHGLVIVLAANLLNLLDLRPGRATKVYLIAWLAIVAGAFNSIAGDLLFAQKLTVPAFVAGSLLVWLFADLREKGMLGDSGSNVLGALLGVTIVLLFGRTGELAAATVLLALNLASEVWSFSNFIDKVPPLRWIDRLGRKREETLGSAA